MNKTALVTMVATAIMVSGFALAQPDSDKTSARLPSAGIEPGVEPPAYTHTRRPSEEVLNPNRSQAVILPGGAGKEVDSGKVTSKEETKTMPSGGRLPEGYAIGARMARIEKEDEWYVATLDPQKGFPDAPPLRLLPNPCLSMIEAVLEGVRNPCKFQLTGRVTEFRGMNYLLLEHVTQVVLSAEKPQAAPKEENHIETMVSSAAVKPEHIADQHSVTSATITVASQTSSNAEPSAEEVIRQLMQSEPPRALVLPEPVVGQSEVPQTRGSGVQQNATKSALPPEKDATGSRETMTGVLADSTWLIDQLGRVVPSKGFWWSLVIEDRGRSASQKPLKLLPNRLLENAIGLTGDGTRAKIFYVSGEVATYKEQNYLLIRKILVRRDMGNLH